MSAAVIYIWMVWRWSTQHRWRKL